MGHMLRCLALWTLVCLMPAQAQVIWPTRGWQSSPPEEQGMDSAALQSLVEFGSSNHVDSLLVARNGKIVLEAYYAPFGPGTRHAINSATKGVVAGLAGIAIDKGMLRSVDTPLLDLLPGRTGSSPDPRKKAITLQHLLDMTSGLDWKEPLSDAVPETLIQMRRAPDWTQFILDRPMAQAPGAGFNYNSGNWNLVSAILARSAGMSTEDFGAEHLFKPLGIADWHWRKDPGGISGGGSGLYLQPRDMVKIAYLYLHHGQWEGRPVISRAWVEKVFRASVPMQMGPGADFRYGDGWWTIPGRKAYMAVGFHRQIILVLPESGVVAALTGRSHYSIEQMLDLVAASVKSVQPLPANPVAAQALAARVEAAGREKPDVPAPPPPMARSVFGKTWKLAPNDLGIKEFTLRLGGEPTYEIVSHVARGSAVTRTLVYRLGLEGRYVRTDRPEGAVLSKASWVNDNSLLVEARMMEEGETATYLLRFDGNKVAVDYRHTTGFRARFSGEVGN